MRIASIGIIASSVGLFFGIYNLSYGQVILKVVGSTTFKNALLEPNKQTLEEKTGLKLDIIGNGSGRGLQDLVEGKGDVAMISSELKSVAEKINAKTPGAIDIDQLNAVLIEKAQVEIVVHPSNTIKTLKNAQVVDLLGGKIKNWKEIGGLDLPVIVVTAHTGDGVRTTIESELLKETQFASDARQLASATQVSKIVTQMPGAIGGISKKDAGAGVSIIQIEKAISAPLFLVTKGMPSSDVQKLITELKNLQKK